jgi:sortase A
VLLNWGYVSARLSYFFFTPNANEVIKPSVVEPAKGEGSWPKNVLAIPSLGVNVPVVYIQETGETAFQNALAGGVVHYPGSSMPGEVGNVYIFGHSSDYAWSKGNYKHAFALLPKIKNGAEIKLTDEKGFSYTYLVTRQGVVGPNDVHVLAQNTNGKKLLTLQTSYPLGTALKRYVVVAELRQSD